MRAFLGGWVKLGFFAVAQHAVPLQGDFGSIGANTKRTEG